MKKSDPYAPPKEGDPILAVVAEWKRIADILASPLSCTFTVRRAFVTRTAIESIHFVVGTSEKYLHLAHEGLSWIRYHRHSAERKAALLASGILLGEEMWAHRVILPAGTAMMQLEPGLTVAQGDAVYISPKHSGCVTNTPAFQLLQVGIVLNATPLNGAVLCHIVDPATVPATPKDPQP